MISTQWRRSCYFHVTWQVSTIFQRSYTLTKPVERNAFVGRSPDTPYFSVGKGHSATTKIRRLSEWKHTHTYKSMNEIIVIKRSVSTFTMSCRSTNRNYCFCHSTLHCVSMMSIQFKYMIIMQNQNQNFESSTNHVSMYVRESAHD